MALCITGSAAAYKSIDLARQLIRHGADVIPVMTRKATEFVGPELLHWATGNRPVVELTGGLEHVELAGDNPSSVNVVLVAPATATTVSKIACGDASTPVTALVNVALGTRKPVVVVPAMHEQMYRNPAIVEMIEKLTSMGVHVLPPLIEEGKAKIPPLEEIVEAVIASLRRKTMRGFKVLITAGPTVERIDPVRILTNPSSGRMGAAIAWEALARGAEVTIVHGPVHVLLPRRSRLRKVYTTEEMLSEVERAVKEWGPHMAMAVAAVADYKPEREAEMKMSTESGPIQLRFVPTPKVVDKLAELGIPVAAFRAVYKAGSDDEMALMGREYIRKHSGIFAVAVNDVSEPGLGFASEYNRFVLVSRNKVEKLPPMKKRVLAIHILDFLEGEIPERNINN